MEQNVVDIINMVTREFWDYPELTPTQQLNVYTTATYLERVVNERLDQVPFKSVPFSPLHIESVDGSIEKILVPEDVLIALEESENPPKIHGNKTTVRTYDPSVLKPIVDSYFRSNLKDRLNSMVMLEILPGYEDYFPIIERNELRKKIGTNPIPNFQEFYLLTEEFGNKEDTKYLMQKFSKSNFTNSLFTHFNSEKNNVLIGKLKPSNLVDETQDTAFVQKVRVLGGKREGTFYEIKTGSGAQTLARYDSTGRQQDEELLGKILELGKDFTLPIKISYAPKNSVNLSA